MRLSEYSSYESDFESEEYEYEDDFEEDSEETMVSKNKNSKKPAKTGLNNNANGYYDDNHLYVHDVVKKSGCETFVINFDDCAESSRQNSANNKIVKRPQTTKVKVKPSKKEAKNSNCDSKTQEGVNTKGQSLLEKKKLARRRPNTALEAKNQRPAAARGENRPKKSAKARGRPSFLVQGSWDFFDTVQPVRYFLKTHRRVLISDHEKAGFFDA